MARKGKLLWKASFFFYRVSTVVIFNVEVVIKVPVRLTLQGFYCSRNESHCKKKKDFQKWQSK